MNSGFVFLVLMLASAAVAWVAFYAPPASLSFGMQMVLFVALVLATFVFGFLAAVTFLFGAST